jgi:hypothetical protein
MLHDDAHLEEQEIMEQPYSLARNRKRREIRQPTRYADFACCLAVAENV